MSLKFLLSASLALACLSTSAVAHAQHDVRAFLSTDGMDFMATEAPSFLPTVFTPADFTQPAGCVTFEQNDTTINFAIDDVVITVPRSGRIRVDMHYSASVTGELYADNIYACIGELRCQDDIIVRDGTAVFEYDISILDGDAQAVPVNVDFMILPEDVTLVLSECNGQATGETFNDLLEFSKDWMLIALEATLNDLAEQHLGPYLEGLFGGFNFDGTVGIASYSASLQDLDVESDGMDFRIEGDMIDTFAAAACVARYDNGSPEDFVGETPIIDGPSASHIGLAVNIGMANKALYTVWRRGLMCLTDDHLVALGLELDLNIIGGLLPGFPAGTKLSLDMKLSQPPSVRPEVSDGSTITVEMKGIIIDLHGDRPDGSRNTLHVEIDAEATGTLTVDRATNAIIANLNGAKIYRLVLEDERDAANAGFDVSRLVELIEDHILPDVVAGVGSIPLTGPTFSFEKYAIILRTLLTNDAFISMGLDLFRIPDVDTGFPDTLIIESPNGPVSPRNAIVRVIGDDVELPPELLQFEVSIDNVMQSPSFVQTIQVGEAGVSATYKVSIAAVDFAGNVDPTPAEVDVIVDGVSPVVAIVGSRNRPANKGPVNISWNMSDDLTSSLGVRVEIYDVVDPADSLSAVLIDTQNLAAGTTSTQVDISGSSRVYRVEIHVIDDAGNDSIASMLLTNPDTGGCGCTVGGRSEGSGAGLWLLALGALAFLRRRRAC